MTDIVEQVARVLSTQTTCDGEPHPTEVHLRQAQALADAGLLAEDAALITTVGGLEALPVGTAIRTQSGAVAVKHDTTDYPWQFADDTQDRFTNIGMIDCHIWPFTVLHQPGISSARTVPNRAAIAQALYINHRDHISENQTALDLAEKGTDAVLELIRQRETKDVYELAAERIGAESTWTVDAREALGLTRTESSRLITDVQDLEMSLDRVVIRDADGDIYERQGELETERGTYAAWLGTHTGIKPSPDIRLPATVIYVPGEIVGDRPTRQEVWQEAFSAGYMDGQTYTVPTRGEIAEALHLGYSRHQQEKYKCGTCESTALRATKIEALLAGQPTVNEAKAQALEEAADDLEADLGTTGPGNRRTGYGAVALDLLRLIRNRAQQIRDGK